MKRFLDVSRAVARNWGSVVGAALITTAMPVVLPSRVSGAAINSALRQVGAAGTAVLGSVLTADYQRHTAPSLPEAARDQAAEPAQGIRSAAAREPWPVDAANHAFPQAMCTSSIWATRLSLIEVAFVFRCFRSDR